MDTNMKTILTAFALTFSLAFIGCHERIIEPDITPPSAPRGLATSTGDHLVDIFWLANPERDVAGYNVLVSSSYDGEYILIGTTRGTSFTDAEARNGYTYYYAVTAFDYDNNESVLSKEVAYDTPRPEGYNIPLANFRTTPNSAGYDFSSYTIGDYNDKYTDVYFEYYEGSFYLVVWEDTDIQDMGYTKSLYEIGEAPASGWSPTKDVRVIPGHTYVVWTWDDHYAKIRVNSVSTSRVTFDWAYQLQKSNPRLKRSIIDDRKPLAMGEGATTRK
jgi:hypothetical protein